MEEIGLLVNHWQAGIQALSHHVSCHFPLSTTCLFAGEAGLSSPSHYKSISVPCRAHAAFKVNQRSWFDAPLLQQHTFSQNHVSNGVCDLNCCNCLCLCMIGQSKWEINILSSLAAKEADRVDLIWLDLSALSFTAIIHSQRIWGQSSRTTSLQ